MTLLGYARVSRIDQNPDLQEQALQAAGCSRVWVERASGRANSLRPELVNIMEHLRAGDVLVVWKLDRLGRSLSHLVSLLDDLRTRDIEFRSLTEGIDTTTSLGRLMFNLCGAFAEMERELMLERTNAGLAAARAKGRVGGQLPKLNPVHMTEARRMIAAGYPKAHIARVLNVHRATLNRALAREEAVA